MTPPVRINQPQWESLGNILRLHHVGKLGPIEITQGFSNDESTWDTGITVKVDGHTYGILRTGTIK